MTLSLIVKNGVMNTCVKFPTIIVTINVTPTTSPSFIF